MLVVEYEGSQAFGAWLENEIPEVEIRRRGSTEGLATPERDLLILEGGEASGGEGSALILRVLSEAEASGPCDPSTWKDNELLMVRGPQESAQLRAALRQGVRTRRATELRETLCGPYAHDLRGTAGVLGLANQVLVATGASGSVTKKLKACAARLDAHFDDLVHLAPSYLGGRHLVDSPGDSWSQAINATRSWFEAAHRGAHLQIVPESWAQTSAPAEATSILRALVDVIARTCPRGETVSLELTINDDGSASMVSRGSAVQVTAEQRAALRQPPENWSARGPSAVPYRLRYCALWASQNNASITVEVSEAEFVARLGLQSGAFSPSGRA